MNLHKNPAGRRAMTNLFADKMGVEIGTERGRYAVLIAEVASHLTVVDLWKSYGNYRTHVTESFYEEILTDAHKRLDKYRVRFLREDSVDAADNFDDESLEFIYLDSSHVYEHTKKELAAWYPKLVRNGIFAGHDFFDRGERFGVKQAVLDFCGDNGIDEITEWCGDKSHSFHFVKPIKSFTRLI